jgi:hypothetical protein
VLRETSLFIIKNTSEQSTEGEQDELHGAQTWGTCPHSLGVLRLPSLLC